MIQIERVGNERFAEHFDFLLGYCARFLPRRPTGRWSLTSPTIDADRFAAAL